jgi:Fe-S-cluster containining protein
MEIIYTMSTTMQKLITQMTDEELYWTHLTLERLRINVRWLQGQRSQLGGVSSIINELMQQFLDQDLANIASGAGEITCTKGCNHCCKQVVAITLDEAHLLLRVVRQRGMVLDEDRLRRQADYGEETWRDQPAEDRACPFLQDDGLCGVYQNRPMSCRKYFSVANPDLCNIETSPGSDVPIWYSYRAEAMTTAVLTESMTGFMPEMLLAALRLEKEEAYHGEELTLAHARQVRYLPVP